MSLTIQDVQRVAFLSRLKLSETEITKFQQQLSSVLEYINVLNEIDTKSIEPTLSVTGSKNRLRDDVHQPYLSQSEALQNAKNHNAQYFITPAVFE